MTLLITDPALRSRLIAERQVSGGDRYDEVWEGIYVMASLANDEHQDIQTGLVGAIRNALGWDGPAKVRAGVNISDRHRDWIQNYRCPDVVVYLPGNAAVNRDSHWQGGPDFLVEIISPYDRSLEKLAFYAAVGVREMLIVDRDPWALELYQLNGTPPVLQRSCRATVEAGEILTSSVLPLSFQLIAQESGRPKIEATTTSGAPGRWAI